MKAAMEAAAEVNAALESHLAGVRTP